MTAINKGIWWSGLHDSKVSPNCSKVPDCSIDGHISAKSQAGGLGGENTELPGKINRHQNATQKTKAPRQGFITRALDRLACWANGHRIPDDTRGQFFEQVVFAVHRCPRCGRRFRLNPETMRIETLRGVA